MDLLKLIDERKQKTNRLTELGGLIAKENRKFNEGENQEFNQLKKDIAEIDSNIKNIEENNKNNSINTNKMKEKFSLIKALKNEVDRRNQPEHIQEVIQEGRNSFVNSGLEVKGNIQLPWTIEQRAALNYTGNSTTGVINNSVEFLAPLRANLASVQAGATVLTGLNSKLTLSTFSGNNVYWADENGDAQDGTGSFSAATYEPKRLTAYIDISKMLLETSNPQVEQMLVDDITAAIAAKLEATIFGKHAHAANTPDGLFTAGYTPTVSGDTSFGRIVDLETACDTGNALTGNLAYLTHPSLLGKMKQVAKATNQAIMVAEGGQANGYPVYRTTAMATGLGAGSAYYGIVFANWKDLVFANFGAIDILPDVYSQAGKGMVRIWINSYWDVKFRRSASYKVGLLK